MKLHLIVLFISFHSDICVAMEEWLRKFVKMLPVILVIAMRCLSSLFLVASASRAEKSELVPDLDDDDGLTRPGAKRVRLWRDRPPRGGVPLLQERHLPFVPQGLQKLVVHRPPKSPYHYLWHQTYGQLSDGSSVMTTETLSFWKNWQKRRRVIFVFISMSLCFPLQCSARHSKKCQAVKFKKVLNDVLNLSSEILLHDFQHYNIAVATKHRKQCQQ